MSTGIERFACGVGGKGLEVDEGGRGSLEAVSMFGVKGRFCGSFEEVPFCDGDGGAVFAPILDAGPTGWPSSGFGCILGDFDQDSVRSF